MTQIAIVCTSKSVDRAQLALLVNGWDRQAREFAAAWTAAGIPVEYKPVVLYDTPSDLPPDVSDFQLLTIEDDIDAPGAEGFHDDQLGVIFARCLPENNCEAVPHEILEMMADQTCNQYRDIGDGTGRQIALEVCLTGETMLRLASGGSAQIADLVGANDLYVLGAGPSGGRAERAWNIRLTKRHAPVVVVVTSKGTIRCTPDHRVLLGSGEYRAANRLRAGDVLFDMGPGFSETNSADRCGMKPKSTRQCSPRLHRRSDHAHVVIGELGHPVAHSTKLSVASHPPLRRSVEHIFSMRSDEEMRGVRATRVVAAMAHLSAEGNWADMNLIRQSVNEMAMPIESHLSIASRVARSWPAPAVRTTDYTAAIDFSRRARATGNMPAPTGFRIAVPAVSRPMQSAETLGKIFPGTPIDRARAHGSVVYRVEADGNADVYDLAVPGTHNVALANGAVVHNCDPVEEDHYPQQAQIGDQPPQDVPVSNYVLPSYFDPNGKAPFDRMGKLTAPFTMTPGGYMIVRAPDGSTTDVFAMTEKGRATAERKRQRPDSRVARRLAKRPEPKYRSEASLPMMPWGAGPRPEGWTEQYEPPVVTPVGNMNDLLEHVSTPEPEKKEPPAGPPHHVPSFG